MYIYICIYIYNHNDISYIMITEILYVYTYGPDQPNHHQVICIKFVSIRPALSSYGSLDRKHSLVEWTSPGAMEV